MTRQLDKQSTNGTAANGGFAGFRSVPRTGVIYVMTEAMRAGYKPGSSTWANLGQGAPEAGPLTSAPSRATTIELRQDDLEYAPIDGLYELREAVAKLYNDRYRQDKKSKYTAENVSIAGGGRTAITRLVSSLGRTNVGHFLPDYTAYEELLGTFAGFVPIPILLDPSRAYSFTAAELDKEILGRGFSTILFSNPCNPTGKVVRGDELHDWVACARNRSCNLILDEFYGHYLYDSDEVSVSAAKYVEDVNSDPIIIVDGLTKNWRYPGFRLSWTLAPKPVIEAVASAGSFLDGGACRPIQRAALDLVDRSVADEEARGIQKTFLAKRDFLVHSLKELGIVVSPEPSGSFYCWGDLGGLPESLNTGMKLFRKALEVGVIIVPGSFFDINPGQRRPDRQSRFERYARFSFGPSMKDLERGISSLKKLF